MPESLFVGLFEEQAAERPATVAVVHNGSRLTYSQLNARANLIARRLLDRGLIAEDVVAVLTHRNLNWLVAALGVLKAGGAYLPLNPDFPAARINSQLNRSDCRFVIAERGVTENDEVDVVGPSGNRVLIDAGLAEDIGDPGNPNMPISPGQLAYVYFTSGSTGEPKGAMCEHAGMLNHLLMKIEDMEIHPGDTVLQTASQCFDISLWQWAAPLLTGGTSEICDSDIQLDVARFVDRISTGGIHVAQVVPSYLDVLLTYLEQHPCRLGDLRSLSVTGEALKYDLVRRWFALQPEIFLVNAYGATEVSDDTMHAILRSLPEEPFISLGHSRRNVVTHILDERLRMVPLGAPGEIVFSGMSVGRGYINDPSRTTQVFAADPHRPGNRLYHTGDFGRWLPGGDIEYLGRRDEQVKLRGFRVEIGEIENQLLRMPGIKQVATVVGGKSGENQSLIAFYTGTDNVEAADLRDFLAASLPDYMIPAYFHRCDALPLTQNGKVDKLRLAEAGVELTSQTPAYTPPATQTEKRLAILWAEILRVPVARIGQEDDFFESGGTSLSAVRLLVKLNGSVSLRQMTSHPRLRDLATIIDSDTAEDRTDGTQRLMQRAAAPTGPVRASLVCFPYAGGNAVNFHQMAVELSGQGVSVRPVELPGHDLSRPDEPLLDVTEAARQVHRELMQTVDGPILLWGQCAGAAIAIELCRLMERAGNGPARLLLGALMLDEPAVLRVEAGQVEKLSDDEVIGKFHEETAYVELDLLKSKRAELVARAYRHDVISANRYLADLQLAADDRLSTPVDIVVTTDDPSLGQYQDRYLAWERTAKTVSLHLVGSGGHYFVRTNPSAAAAAVSDAMYASTGR